MKRNQIEVSLRIVGFECQPEEITQELGIQPTKVWQKGEQRNARGIMRNKQNGWGISSGIGRHKGFEHHMDALMMLIEPHLSSFTRVCNQYHTELSCAVYMYYDNGESIPWLGFDKRAVEFLHRIGAVVDFDMYVVPAE